MLLIKRSFISVSVILVEFSSIPEMKLEKLPFLLPLSNCLQHGAKIVTSIFIRAKKADLRNISVKITYSLDSEKPVISIKNETIVLPVVKPFEISTRYVSAMLQNIQKFYTGEQFGVMPIIQFTSPWTIEIENTSIEFVSLFTSHFCRLITFYLFIAIFIIKIHPVKSVEKELNSYLVGRSYKKEEIATELFLAVSKRQSDQNLVIGEYKITWKRYLPSMRCIEEAYFVSFISGKKVLQPRRRLRYTVIIAIGFLLT